VSETMSSDDEAVDFMGHTIVTDKALEYRSNLDEIVNSVQAYSASDVVKCLNKYIFDPSRIHTADFKKDSDFFYAYVMPVLQGIDALLEKEPDINHVGKLLLSSNLTRSQLDKFVNVFWRKCWKDKKDAKEESSYLVGEFRDFLWGDDAVELEEIRDYFAFVEMYESSAAARVR